jgi:hypothetical protein
MSKHVEIRIHDRRSNNCLQCWVFVTHYVLQNFEICDIHIYVTCVATGICIARHESSLNTAALGPINRDGSRDNGIFQVSSRLFYHKKQNHLFPLKRTPHAWRMDCLQKATPDQLLSKFIVL